MGTRADKLVIILPSVPTCAENPLPYNQRGWCYFEMSISSQYARIGNQHNRKVEAILAHEKMPTGIKNFKKQFINKTFTAQFDEELVLKLFRSVCSDYNKATCRVIVQTTVVSALSAITVATVSSILL